MKLGLFYQSGHKIEACYFALEQFRKFYPSEPIALWEDNTNILVPVSRKFNCDYKKTTIPGLNTTTLGRPVYNLETLLSWYDRVYESCLTTLSSADWVMNFEDDVWFKKRIEGEPPFDLSGILGRGWHDDLYNHLQTSVKGCFGCGGSIFNRLKFIEAYNKLKNVDWQLIDNLAKDPKPTEWTDSGLTFLFYYSKFSVGGWVELSQYRSQKIHALHDLDCWWESINNNNGSVIHGFKPYYFPTLDQTDYVKTNLLQYL